MKTIKYISNAIYDYIGKLRPFIGKSETSKGVVEQLEKNFCQDLTKFSEKYPEIMQISINGMYTTSSIIDQIRKNATKRYSIPAIPITNNFVDIIQTSQKIEENSYVVTPHYVDMGNLVIRYQISQKQQAEQMLKVLTFNSLLTVPINKLSIRLVDLSFANIMGEIEEKLPESLISHETIHSRNDLSIMLQQIEKTIDANIKKYSDVRLFNEGKRQISQPYEIILFTDEWSEYDSLQEKIMNLASKSTMAGIYFFMLVSDDGTKEKFKDQTFYEVIDIADNTITKGIVSPSLIWNNVNLRNDCFEYFRSEAETSSQNIPNNSDVLELGNMPYEIIEKEIIIPIGDGTQFCLNTIDHVHAFVLGQSGSGKSVLLHNIIGSAILKYAPEDLQLYLLDFKLGGVEFNRYKGVKHVRAMLVDNSDQQISLEILRELREKMTERGRLFRAAGVSNIIEYNNAMPDKRMPNIMVVVDECHELFRSDNSIPYAISNEIADIIIKIAKEGRSQGVHIVFATQTLSGTDISNEILNNVSDFYLLKCAQGDSEKLVPDSSSVTSTLSTGDIYYHHVNGQKQFRSYYHTKEDSESIVKMAISKSTNHNGYGNFYFCGSQIFHFDKEIASSHRRITKYPVAFLGKTIDLSQQDLAIVLRDDFSENILVSGLNDGEQATRTVMNMVSTLIMTGRIGQLHTPIKIINCLTDDDSDYEYLLEDMEEAGLLEVISRRKRGDFLKGLAESVNNGSAQDLILVILGQDKFRELKMDMQYDADHQELNSLSLQFGSFSNNDDDVKSYRQALRIILDKGPEMGVHTILQVEKVTNLLYSDLTPKEVYQKFKHLILLKSDDMAASRLNLRDDIHLEKLSKEEDRLRAYYYAEESDEYTLFTPYAKQDNSTIINLLKEVQ